MRVRALVRIGFLLGLVLASLPPVHAAGPILVVEVKGAIGVAANGYIARALEQGVKREAPLIVLQLDTPGGLVTSTRDIIDAILASPVPVAVYVAPSGARAASAGTYILYAGHVAAMAPGTHLGAATPVSLGAPPGMPPERERRPPEGEGNNRSAPPGAGSAMEHKIVNDAAAYLRALAQLRGRNPEFAEKAVREAATLTASEAKEAGVLDLLVASVPELLTAIDGRTVNVAGRDQRLATREATIERVAPDWRTRVIAAITDPNVAYLLLIIGFYGLVFEIWNPGAIFPGVAGGICLLLALAALAVLPVSYAGLALIILGLGLMLAEALTPGLGVLGFGGLAAFVAGSIFLFDPEDVGGAEFALAWPTIAAAAAASAGFFFLILGFAFKARRRPVITGIEEMTGSSGLVIEWNGDRGRVRAHGEIWQARASAGLALAPGASVRVIRLDGLTAIIEPAPESPIRR